MLNILSNIDHIFNYLLYYYIFLMCMSSLLKVAARIRRRRGRKQFFTREQGPVQFTHPGTPIIRS